MKTFSYLVDQEQYSIKVDGDTAYGEHTQLLQNETNLIAHSTFADLGYTVVDFLSSELLLDLRTKIVSHLNKHITPVTNKEYTLDTICNYHKDVTNDQHHRVVSSVYDPSGHGIKTTDIDFDFTTIESRISEICNHQNLSCRMPGNQHKEFYVRLVRPASKADANPPHRDVWIPRLKNAVNIHFIVAGNHPKSTLAVLPGSHLWYEDEMERTVSGASTNGNKYQVPSVVNATRSMNFIRPRMASNDV